uniref:CCAAT-binding factor domain-containing protein n=1 Tax=Setaria digitata TaxID=48799 RepID=A0A915PTU4_9BILA
MVIDHKKKNVSAMKTIRKKTSSSSAVTPLVLHSPETKWYNYGNEERAEQLTSNLEFLSRIEEQAEILLKIDCELQREIQSKKSMTETAWLSTVLTRGTANDKISAMQLLTQRQPVHSLAYVASLVGTVAKKNTREAFSLLGLLKDLFINELLPPGRKLIPFSARPVDEINLSSLDRDRNLKRKLILWKFESDLKAVYEKFVGAIERLAGENVEKLCTMSCRYALELLIARPEQEQKLLSMLTNKLGHPNKTVATRVCGYLLQLTRKQPLMRLIVVKEVERLIYRKNISCSAQLHAISFLSQLNLYGCDPTLPSTLLNIYVGLFRIMVLNKKMDDKMLNALLLATNRAFSYAKGDVDKLTKEIDTLYKILHQSNFSTAVQTLKLLYQLLTTSEGISDRFYAALYRRILDLQHSPNIDRQLFSLLYQALSSDIVEYRVIAFIKRLLQLSLCRNAPFAAATLILISRLIDKRPSLLLIKKSADLTKFSKDLQSEVIDDDDDEIYQDYDISSEQATTEIPVTSKFEDGETGDVKPCEKKVFGWVHKNNIVIRDKPTSYDPAVRNPLFAVADRSIATELTLLSTHYHPSVAVFASNLLNGISVRYDGDPLFDFTQMRFLDRFVFRNPKTRGVSEKILRRKVYDPHGIRKLPVISKEYAAKNKNEIPIDERFLHRFVSMKMRMKKEKESEVVHDDDDIESVNSDEFNILLSRFEPGERREVFDIDFSQEFSVEKKKKEVKSRKRQIESDTDREGDDDDEERSGMDAADDDDFEGWSVDDNEEESDDVEEESNEGIQREENYISDASDDSDEFAEQLDCVEDAAQSADKFTAMLEEEDESRKKESRRKNQKFGKFKKRRNR